MVFYNIVYQEFGKISVTKYKYQSVDQFKRHNDAMIKPDWAELIQSSKEIR